MSLLRSDSKESLKGSGCFVDSENLLLTDRSNRSVSSERYRRDFSSDIFSSTPEKDRVPASARSATPSQRRYAEHMHGPTRNQGTPARGRVRGDFADERRPSQQPVFAAARPGAEYVARGESDPDLLLRIDH